MKKLISDRIKDSIEVKAKLLENNEIIEQIENISVQILDSLKNNGKVFFAGNGGSFSDSFHLAGEFVSRFLFDRSALPAIALGGNNSIVTAVGNDYSYDEVFSRELEALSKPGDIFIGISTSGNSKNIIKAIEVAKSKDIKTFILTGETGGKIASLCDCVKVPSALTARIQEVHITLGHIICEIVEREYFK